MISDAWPSDEELRLVAEVKESFEKELKEREKKGPPFGREFFFLFFFWGREGLTGTFFSGCGRAKELLERERMKCVILNVSFLFFFSAFAFELFLFCGLIFL